MALSKSHESVWIEPVPTDDGQTSALPPVIAGILKSRGVSTEEARDDFLNPRLKNLGDPFALPGMAEAVERILRAREKEEKIVIFGDYDVDGVTSVTLLTRFLQMLGCGKVFPFLPMRMEEGYGLSEIAIRRCLQAHAPDLFIAVDCGTNSIHEAGIIRQTGADVIILDHHEPRKDTPGANGIFTALVNPKLTGEYDYLCSVGICFKLAHAILKKLDALGQPQAREIDIREFLDLVAVGTIADIVPLTGDNRIMAKAGLKKLATTQHPGFAALKEVCGIKNTPTSYHVGFMIGPRLNAMGRLESAMTSLELLLTDQMPRARELAQQLDGMNRERQELEQSIFDEALHDARGQIARMPGARALVLGRPQWHPGVVGIVASRILREFHLPVIVVGFDTGGLGKGSGRSVEGFNLVDALTVCAGELIKFGGHAMAAGITIAHDRLNVFRDKFQEIAASKITDDMVAPKLKIDGIVAFKDINAGFLSALESLEPFGHSNPEPLFLARKIRVTGEPFFMGQEKRHLKLRLEQDGAEFEGVYFRFDGRMDTGKLPLLDIVFVPEWNEFRGNRKIQLKLKAIREHRPQ